MKKRQFVGLCVTLVLLVCASCGDDSDDGPIVWPDPLPMTKDRVLVMLQKAYTGRNIVEYQELLDADFIFHFSSVDYKKDIVSVDSWDRASEIAATENIFDRNYSTPYVNPISKIDLVLTYLEGEDSWDPVTPEDQETYPDETWYEKTVRYDIVMSSGPIDFVGLNIQATFIVRRAEVDSNSIWRIISWRDDTENQLTRLRAGLAGGGSAEETTWGKVKSLYSQ